MTIGWQEIIAIGVVVLAAFILVRRALAKSNTSDGCGGTCSARPSTPDRGIQIKELHRIEINRSLPQGKDEG